MAINAPIQGTEADIVKIAMIKVDEFIRTKSLEKDVYTLLQVHDELVYEITQEKAESVAKEIQKIMESVLLPKDIGGVTLSTSAATGLNWGELK